MRGFCLCVCEVWRCCGDFIVFILVYVVEELVRYRVLESVEDVCGDGCDDSGEDFCCD